MMKNIGRKIVAIVGPTASGKTAIGVKLAKKFNGEIVSADSRQIFRGLDLGTGKEGAPNQKWTLNQSKLGSGQATNKTNHEKNTIEHLRDSIRTIDEIPQWVIDICDPGEEFNLFKYTELAKMAIEDILSRGKLPILVGGTGLYVQSLVEGFQLKTNYESRIMNYGVYSREQLEQFTTIKLQEILKKIDSEAFEKLSDQKNPHRLIRAIERTQSGIKMTKVKPKWDILQIAVDLPRETLNKRIDKRAEDRFEQGMLEEVEGLLESGVNQDWLVGLGLEYRIIGKYILNCHSEADVSAEESSEASAATPRSFATAQRAPFGAQDDKEYELMKEELKLRSHQYAKRQVTWFKRFPEIIWLSNYEDIEKKVQDYLGRNNR